MSTTVTLLTPRVRLLLKEADGKKPIGVTYLHQVMRNEYIAMEQRLPQPYAYTANAGTIAAAADSFTLPTTSSAEYAGDIRIQLVASGRWLNKVTQDEMTVMRQSQTASNAGGLPTDFAPYEDVSQQVTCWVYPRNKDVQTYNLFVSLKNSDFGADFDATTLALSRDAQTALVYKTAAALLFNMDDDELKARGLPASSAGVWDKKGEVAIYQEQARRFRIEGTGVARRFLV